MEIFYSHSDLDRIKHDGLSSVFLAGPTPRINSVKSWRGEAISIFRQLNFSGCIITPEFDHGRRDDKIDIPSQIEWEEKGLTYATCILFWIPRNMLTMPALTTNDEWGTWKNSGKVVIGAPDDAVHIRYQKYYARKLNIPFSNSLRITVIHAIDLVNKLKRG